MNPSRHPVAPAETSGSPAVVSRTPTVFLPVRELLEQVAAPFRDVVMGAHVLAIHPG